MEVAAFKEKLKSTFLLLRGGDVDDSHGFVVSSNYVTIKEIKDAVRDLPEKQREAFTRVIIECRKTQDVADLMKIKQPNVVRYVTFACEKLLAGFLRSASNAE